MLIIMNLLFYTIFGACVGSFLTMLFHRIPDEKDLVFLNSHCPSCGKKLKKISLIPIFSYIKQKGKCLECGVKIDKIYLIIELINTFFYIFLYFSLNSNIKTIFMCLLFSTIFLIMLIDLKYMEIPLQGLFMLTLLMILHILFNPIDALFAFISVIIYYCFVKIIVIFLEYRQPNKEFLGGGDEKLIVICGGFLTLKNFSLFFMLTGIFGILFAFLWKKIFKKEVFPFAPAILLSLFSILLYYYFNSKLYF